LGVYWKLIRFDPNKVILLEPRRCFQGVMVDQGSLRGSRRDTLSTPFRPGISTRYMRWRVDFLTFPKTYLFHCQRITEPWSNLGFCLYLGLFWSPVQVWFAYFIGIVRYLQLIRPFSRVNHCTLDDGLISWKYIQVSFTLC
jgi:hypothetical protein